MVCEVFLCSGGGGFGMACEVFLCSRAETDTETETETEFPFWSSEFGFGIRSPAKRRGVGMVCEMFLCSGVVVLAWFVRRFCAQGVVVL